MCSANTARKFFNEHSQTWDEEINASQVKQIKNIFSKKLSFIKGPFLDLGSGTGVLIPILRKYNAQNSVIVELDIALKMLQRARAKHNSRQLNYILADAHNLPLLDNFFSTVICFQVYPHFDDKYKAAQEIFKVMKNGGKLIILHLMSHKALNEMHQKAGREVAEDRIYAAPKLAQLLASAGFKIQHVEEKEDIYLIIADKE